MRTGIRTFLISHAIVGVIYTCAALHWVSGIERRFESERQNIVHELSQLKTKPSDADMLDFWFGDGDKRALLRRLCSKPT